ncbi:alpha/beta fold hydrolase [Montanilutibacter psychrotolerans]|uniref:Alpha/beta hydrolase n=1 Tax=Montanilutibacter psychrotolerans TaxID=1327343 RepID=A0A3M8SNP1_9GAMM|nr:alpha/beta hydrolase [Lysobacter psychrotolerans]RNF82927.1 alpha/beta hydrolase [Lysobacter psychrotolerans]
MGVASSRVRRLTRAAALVAAALLLAGVVIGVTVWRDPDVLVRVDFHRQRVAVGLSQASIQVGDHRWTYAYSNDAPADAPVLVMVHGFTGSKENWYPLAHRLHGRYRVLIPDLPGWGASERRPGADYGYAAQAARVADFIEVAVPAAGGKGARTERVLLGHSMGGGIAALVAARRPDLVDRVGLLNASGVRFADNRFGTQVLAGRNPFEVTDPATLQRYLDILFQDPAAKPWIPWPADGAYIARRRADVAFEQSVLDRIGRGNERFLPGDEAGRIRQPALLLWCRQDAVIDASAMGLYWQRMPQARRVLLEGCGHMSLMERPDAVAGAVQDLIEQGTSR